MTSPLEVLKDELQYNPQMAVQSVMRLRAIGVALGAMLASLIKRDFKWEACDDAQNGNNDDGCTDICTIPTCGDGLFQPSGNGEQCAIR